MWRVGSPVQREIDIPKRPGHRGHAGSISRKPTRLDSSLSLSDVLYKGYSSGWYSDCPTIKGVWETTTHLAWSGHRSNMGHDNPLRTSFYIQITSLKLGWGGHCGNPEAGDEGSTSRSPCPLFFCFLGYP